MKPTLPHQEKILITGSDGFVAQHLKAELSKSGAKLFNYDVKRKNDITDYENIRLWLDKVKPDKVFHLAAQAFVPESYSNPQRTFIINTIGSINLLEAIKNLGLKTKVLLAGTSEEYGDARDSVSSEEDDGVYEWSLPQPKSPYAVSKLAMTLMGQIYAKSYGVHVVCTRAFNHTGPGRGEMYAESSWAKQIAEIEVGKREYLEHGNLKTRRNYTDVRDVVHAYALAINLEPDIYNICSDQNLLMKEVLDILIGLSEKEIKTKVNPALSRPSDFSFYEPVNDKFVQLTGWEIQHKMYDSMEDLLDYWRARV